MDDEVMIKTLLQCASSGNSESISVYLHYNNLDINCTNALGQTALMLACDLNDWSSVISLVLAGADVNKPDRCGNTPLMYASRKGNWGCIPILDRGRLPLDVNQVNRFGDTALTFASFSGSCDSIHHLLVFGAMVDIRNNLSMTALMIAAQLGHHDCVALLLRAGANLEVEDMDGRSALMLAACYGHVDCLELLLQKGANVNHRNAWNMTPLMEVAQKWIVESFLVLIRAGADINAFNPKQETALMLALQGMCDEAKMAECPQRSKDIVRILIDAGADLEVQDQSGKTALMIASCLPSNFYLCALLVAGANIDHCDAEGNTALIYAMRDERCIQCVNTLINSGINVNIPNKNGQTALMLAASNAQHGQVVKKLLTAGANVNLADSKGRTALMYAVCKDEDAHSVKDIEDVLEALITAAGANINMRDAEGKTALTLAAVKNNKTCVESLVRASAMDVNSQDNTGKTALMHVAIVAGQYPCDQAEAKGYLELVRLLLDYTGNVIVEDNEGLTAVMHSCASKHGINDAFVNHYPTLNALERSDHQGRTAMVHALQRYLSFSEHSYDNYGFLNVQFLLAGGVFPVLSKQYRPLAERAIEKLVRDQETLGTENIWDQLTECEVIFVVSNGVMARPSSCKKSRRKRRPPPLFTPMLDILRSPIGSVPIARYLLANCYVSVTDLQQIRWQPPLEVQDDLRRFLRQAVSKPWPLVKLALVAVSTAIGPSPGRDERIRQIGLPEVLQDCLMFKRPVALLHHRTHNVPMFFDPKDYFQQPNPYPLLYNWPFGYRMRPCNCYRCGQKENRFRRTQFTCQDNRDAVLLW